jgi:hypothetical protein
MAIAETSRHRCLFSSSRTPAANLQQLRGGQSRPYIRHEKPHVEYVFGMAASTLSNGNIRDVISNAPRLQVD